MKKTQINDLRALTSEDLVREIDTRRLQAYKLREKRVVEQLNNPFELGQIRRDIARLRTILRERELQAQGGKPSRKESREVRKAVRSRGGKA